MSSLRLGLLVTALVASSSVVSAQERSREILVDAVVATVEGRIITLSDVDAQAWLTLLERGGVSALDRELDSAFREPVLEFLVRRELILLEAERSVTVEISPDELASQIARLQAHFDDAAAFDAFLFKIGLDRERLSAHLTRSLTADRYVNNRLQLSTRVSDAEVREYYQKHKARLGGRSLAQVRAAIEQTLASQKGEVELNNWLKSLRRRATVRRLEDL